MNKLIVLSVFTLMLGFTGLASTAKAYSVYDIGDTDYYSYGDGSTGTGSYIGDTYYYNDTNGWDGRASAIGDETYYNYNLGYSGLNFSGSSDNIGSTTYYNFNDNFGDNLSGSSYNIGDTTYYTLGGTSWNCSFIGITEYCN